VRHSNPEASHLSAPPEAVAPITASPFCLGLLRRWWVMAFALTGCVMGAGALGIFVLLRQPPTPNCDRVFWPFASASLRLYCAQEGAQKYTLEELFGAIALVDGLPENHPLRPLINRWVEIWSKQALDLAEVEFHQGNLKQAIYYANRIPSETTAHKLVAERVQYWQKQWVQGEKVFKQAEASLNQENWRQAFGVMVKLLMVDNDYWAKTQYESLNQRIIQAQQDESKLVKAERLVEVGGMENLLKAMDMMQELVADSIFKKSANKGIVKIARALMEIAEKALDQEDLNTALDALKRIPQTVSFWPEVKDWIDIAEAMSATWSEDVSGYETAITQLQKIGPQRPLYLKAQEFMQRWSADIAYVRLLGEARGRAADGSSESLAVAIAQARQVPNSSGQWKTAQQAITEWSSLLSTQQDQPILDRADELSFGGDSASLQAAIRQAQQIQQGNPLYKDAQSRIQDWREQVAQRQQVSQPEPPDPAVEAPRETESRILLQEAQALSEQGTANSIASAIETANQIPSASPLRPEAQQSINRWAAQMLELARSRANYDLNEAIAIAQQIPASTPTYDEAQQQVRTWQGDDGQ
jgi:hypothetical protein